MRVIHAHKYFHLADGASRHEYELMGLERAHGITTIPFAMHAPNNLSSPWEEYWTPNLDTSAVGKNIGAVKQLSSAWYNRSAERNFTRLIKDTHPDIIHAHNLYTHLSYSPLVVAKKFDLPVVMTIHDIGFWSANYGCWNTRLEQPLSTSAGFWSTANSRFIKNSFVATATLELIVRLQRFFDISINLVDRFLVSSEFMRGFMIAHGINEERIKVLPLFTTVGRSITDQSIVGQSVGKTATKNNNFAERSGVLFVGRLEGYKGVTDFIGVAVANPQLKFTVIGEGPLRGELELAVKSLKNLTFLGRASNEEVSTAMGKTRILYLPSIWPETFGLVALEGMALGAVVVANAVGGLAGQIKDGQNGRLVTPGKLEEASALIALLHEDKIVWEQLSAGGILHAQTHGNPDQYVEVVERLYKGLVG
ncbi:MAG: glycosyltransferase family 4 protein [Patescibacteria group bacterium]